MDPFHVYQAMRRHIKKKRALQEIKRKYEEGQIEELLEYIRMYADSIESEKAEEKESEEARKLYEYLFRHKEELLPYQKRGIVLLEPKEGRIEYRQMGVQESQNCTVITLRMKKRRMRWSKQGANRMVKLLYKKENKELGMDIKRYRGEREKEEWREEIKEPLSASKVPKRDGKGKPYVELAKRAILLLRSAVTPERKVLKQMLGHEW